MELSVSMILRRRLRRSKNAIQRLGGETWNSASRFEINLRSFSLDLKINQMINKVNMSSMRDLWYICCSFLFYLVRLGWLWTVRCCQTFEIKKWKNRCPLFPCSWFRYFSSHFITNDDSIRQKPQTFSASSSLKSLFFACKWRVCVNSANGSGIQTPNQRKWQGRDCLKTRMTVGIQVPKQRIWWGRVYLNNAHCRDVSAWTTHIAGTRVRTTHFARNNNHQDTRITIKKD